MADDNKPVYTKPSSQLDLEARQADGYVPPSQLKPAEDPKKSENGFIGVDPVYQNFANETEKPFLAENGPESVIEKNFVADDADLDAGATVDNVEDAEADEDDDEKSESGSTTPTDASGAATSGTGSPEVPAPSTPSTPSTPAS